MGICNGLIGLGGMSFIDIQCIILHPPPPSAFGASFCMVYNVIVGKVTLLSGPENEMKTW